MAGALLALGSGSLIGLVLGLIGGGGSILAVPLLVYAVGVPPHIAIGTAAFAVALNALASLALHARRAPIRWPCAIAFSLAGVSGALLGAALGKAVDGRQLLALFGVLMIVVGVLMMRPKPAAAIVLGAPEPASTPGACCRGCLLAGAGRRHPVGLLRHRRRLPDLAGPDAGRRHGCARCRQRLAGRRGGLRHGVSVELRLVGPDRLAGRGAAGGRRSAGCRSPAAMPTRRWPSRRIACRACSPGSSLAAGLYVAGAARSPF